MSNQLYTDLLKQLGESVGLPELAPDEDDYCCLGFDDKIVTHLQFNAENEILMLFVQLGTIDEALQNTVYPKILKANLFWQGTGGATIGIDDETHEVLMCYQTPIRILDFQKFQELLEGFINTAELWINTLESIKRGEIPQTEQKQAAAGDASAHSGIRA